MHSRSEAEQKVVDGLERGEVIASRYVVERLWRKHPLGELYRCTDVTDSRPVLVLRLRREFAQPGVADRLFDTRGRAALGSTMIPEVLDYGTDFDGRPFLVSRTYEAQTLAELERPIAFEQAVEIVYGIASALIAAHAERLVHGGLEPSSVLIGRAGGRPRVVALLGFGLVPALEAGGGKSKTLPLLMTPTHVAPELIGGAPMSPAADVYALGILLWELIYGAPPFRGPTLRVIDAHLNRALPELELPFDVPPAFDWVLRRMLGKSPVDRFADAALVVEQLRPFLGDGIPDMTFELEPSRPVSVPMPVATPVAVDEEDEELTIVFDRGVPELPRRVPELPRSAAELPRPRSVIQHPSPAQPPAIVDDEPLEVPTPSRAKWVAVAMLVAALTLVGVQAIINVRSNAERPAAPPPSEAAR